MTWWGVDLNRSSFQPKQKNRFIVEFGNGGRLLSVSSVTKPSVSIESKQYQMINHYYNYPGIAKWEPIEIKFVDGKIWGTQATTIANEKNEAISQRNFQQAAAQAAAQTFSPFSPPSLNLGVASSTPPQTTVELPVAPINRMTSATLWEMLVASGYTPPSALQRDGTINGRAGSISSPEKASTMDNSFGKTFKIHQLKPEGTNTKGIIQSSETWEIFNPIITKISWGDLSYGDDGLVEYSLSVTYDWAVHHSENKININGGGGAT